MVSSEGVGDDISYMKATVFSVESARAATKGVCFWFTRSDFYVTGLNYVFARVSFMCIAVSIPFYLDKTCGYSKVGDDIPS